MNLHFARPAALMLLAMLPFVWMLMRRGNRLRALVLKRFGLPATPSPYKQAAALAALFFLILALARPYSNEPGLNSRESGDTVFLLDVSRSMLATDVAPNRLERAKQRIRELASQRPHDRLALVAFAGSQSIECALTVDTQFFEQTLTQLGPGSISRGGTRIGDAIRFAVATAFDNLQNGDRQLVILTDGGDQESAPEDAAAEAARRNIAVTVIGIGSSAKDIVVPTSLTDLTPVKFHGQVVHVPLEEGRLKALATIAKGKYWSMDDNHVLPPPQETRTESQYPLGIAFAAIALGCLLTEQILAMILVTALLLNNAPAHAAAAAKNADALARKALESFRMGLYLEAADEYDDAANASKLPAQFLYNRGCALYAGRYYRTALRAFSQAAYSAPKGTEIEALSHIGIANTIYVAAKADTPSNSLEMLVLPNSSIAPQTEQEKRIVWRDSLFSALNHYKAALKINPNLPDAAYNAQVVERRLKALESEQPNSQKEESDRRDPGSVLRRGRLPSATTVPVTRQLVLQDW